MLSSSVYHRLLNIPLQKRPFMLVYYFFALERVNLLIVDFLGFRAETKWIQLINEVTIWRFLKEKLGN